MVEALSYSARPDLQTWLPPGLHRRCKSGFSITWSNFGLGDAWKKSSEGNGTDMHKEMALAHAQYMMRDESHVKFLPPINPKVKTMHVKEQQKQNMFIRDYFSEYKHYRH